MNPHRSDSITDETASHDSIVDPWPIPDPDADNWPAGWGNRSRRNWRVFARPVGARLTEAQHHLYRRIVRPNKADYGLIKRDVADCGTPADYASEIICGSLYEEYQPHITGERYAGKCHNPAHIDGYAHAIATAIQDVVDSRPSDHPPGVSDRDESDADNYPITREQLAPIRTARRRVDMDFAEAKSPSSRSERTD